MWLDVLWDEYIMCNGNNKYNILQVPELHLEGSSHILLLEAVSV